MRSAILSASAPGRPRLPAHAALAAAASLAFGGLATAANFTVTVADAACEDRIGACGDNCTLRDALEAAKNRAGPDNIFFAIPASGTGMIDVCSSSNGNGNDPREDHGHLFDSSVTLSGYSQPGSQENTATDGSFNGRIRIRLRPDPARGLNWQVTADDVSIRGVELRMVTTPGANAAPIKVDGDGFQLLGSRLVVAAASFNPAVGEGALILAGNGARIGSDSLRDHRNVFISDAGATTLEIVGDDTLLRSNVFGRTEDLATAGSAGRHVLVRRGATGTRIGNGTLDGENIFSAAADAAVHVEATLRQATRIEGNRFTQNAGLGIDLGELGVAVADAGDRDGVQNAAFIREATPFLSSPLTAATVRGQLLTDSNLAQDYSFEVYRNPRGCHASGFGEGEFRVHREVLTLGPGAAEFTLRLPTANNSAVAGRVPLLAVGDAISVLVTSAGGDTSEFSRCVIVGSAAQQPPPPPGPNEANVFEVTSSAPSGPGSLLSAINQVNTLAQDAAVLPRVQFRIPATPGDTPRIDAGRLVVLRPVEIDGYTQSQVDPLVRVNSLETGTNARPGIELVGSLAFRTAAQGSLVSGIAFVQPSPGGQAEGLRAAVHSADASALVGIRLRGNFFGATAEGEVLRPLGGTLVLGADSMLGGDDLAQRNWIPAMAGDGVSAGELVRLSAGAELHGNLLGVDRNGVSLIANPVQANLLGNARLLVSTGPASIVGNVFGAQFVPASPNKLGVVVDAPGEGVSVLANRFSGNGQAIDLAPTPGAAPAISGNDVDDVDSGANALQNFPEIALADMAEGELRVDARLDRPADAQPRNYRIDFYASTACLASGHGPGELLLGSRDFVSSDASDERFSVSLSARGIAPGMVLTATATDLASGSTSEMSACIGITGIPTPPTGGDENTIFLDSFE